MDNGKFGAVAAEIRKLGYKLASMSFVNDRGKEVTLWIDDDGESDREDKIRELKIKIKAAYIKDDISAAATFANELIALL